MSVLRISEIWVCIVIVGFFSVWALEQLLDFTINHDNEWWATPLWMAGGLGVLLPCTIVIVMVILHWFKVF